MILVFLIIALFAAYCAMDDLADIGSGRVIHHGKQWLIRAFVAMFIVGSWWMDSEPHWTRVLFVTLACGPLFSLVFRLSLNKLRDHAWWYMGRRIDDRIKDDSAYDTIWHQLVWGIRGNDYVYFSGTQGSGRYPDYDVSSPGTLATVVEAVAFVVLTVSAVFVH